MTTRLTNEKPETSSSEMPLGINMIEIDDGFEQLSAEYIDRLRDSSFDLRTLYGSIAELERGMVRLGFQDIADSYGFDSVLEAVGRTGYGAGEAPERLYKSFEPKRRNRKELLDSVTGTPVDDIVERLHDANGGLVANSGGSAVANLQLDRLHTVDRGWRKHSNSIRMLDAGGLWYLAETRPDLLEAARQDNDLVGLSTRLIETYNEDVEAHNANVEQVKVRLDAEIADKQKPIIELREFSDELFENQIKELEAILEGLDEDSPKGMLIRSRLDALANDAQQERDKFAQDLDTIARQVTDELGIANLDSLDSLLHEQLEARPVTESEMWEWEAALKAANETSD